MGAREERSLDIWLSRLSHISQFGLFLFTAGALYFTVLPLYQKALLDEAIAKAELDLKKKNEALENTYRQLRKLEVRGYAGYAGAECTGLLIPPVEPQLSKRQSEESLAEQILKIDVRGCLGELLEASSMKQVLRSADYEFLANKIQELSIRLEEKKRGAVAEHDSLPERARLNPGSIPPLTGFAARTIELFEESEGRKLGQKVRFEKERLKSAILQAQLDVAAAYRKDIQSELSALMKLKWPDDPH